MSDKLTIGKTYKVLEVEWFVYDTYLHMIFDNDKRGSALQRRFVLVEDKPEEQNYEEWVDETKKKWV
jgi:hypothetical protein